MLSNQLLEELHRLNRTEKIRVVQLLVNELAAEETGLDPAVQYEVWSPQASTEAAATLLRLLEDDKNSGGE